MHASYAINTQLMPFMALLYESWSQKFLKSVLGGVVEWTGLTEKHVWLDEKLNKGLEREDVYKN